MPPSPPMSPDPRPWWGSSRPPSASPDTSPSSSERLPQRRPTGPFLSHLVPSLIPWSSSARRCGEARPMEMFNSSASRKRSSYCKPCQSEFSREHYQKNRARYIERSRARSKRELQWRMGWLKSYLREHPCVDCGETDIMVLEFDHLRDKTFNVSHGIRNMSWERVLQEIQKCEVLCGNCHRLRTLRRLDSLRYRLLSKPRQGRLLIDPE